MMFKLFTHPSLKIKMLLGRASKLSTFKKQYMHKAKLFKILKNIMELSFGQAAFKIMDQNSKNIALINNSRTTCPTSIFIL